MTGKKWIMIVLLVGMLAMLGMGCDSSGDSPCNSQPATIDNDGDGFTENQGDCNDCNASVYPGAPEICGDGIDQDCSGSDASCSDPAATDDDGDGYTEYQGDCNDGDISIHPGAADICGDGIDQDCDGADASCADPNATDNDGDGYTEYQGDCNDGDISVHPGAVDICGDGIDQDCDGADAQCADPADVDDDGDGYTENMGDCDDADPALHPGATDICGDGIDQNCDGTDAQCVDPANVDDDGDGYTENMGDCNDADSAVYPGAQDICGDGIDQNCDGRDPVCPNPLNTDDDGDGYTENMGDCNDFNAAIYPGAPETCGDGIDQNCSGRDEPCQNDDTDDDNDGYTENQGDCNDSNASIYPGATEICGDGIDQNCDGDDLSCSDPDVDDDEDGFTENEGDCDDTNAGIHPDAAEICSDGIDQDCSGRDLSCEDAVFSIDYTPENPMVGQEVDFSIVILEIAGSDRQAPNEGIWAIYRIQNGTITDTPIVITGTPSRTFSYTFQDSGDYAVQVIAEGAVVGEVNLTIPDIDIDRTPAKIATFSADTPDFTFTIPQRPSKVAEIVFVVDQSISFDDDIQTFQSKAKELIEAFSQFGDETRFALVGFSDYPVSPGMDDFPYRLYQDFTENETAFENAISELEGLPIGGDQDEAQLTAVYRSADELSWMENSFKLIFLSTDADFHDKDEEPAYEGRGYTETLNLLLEKEIIVFGLASEGPLTDLSKLASDTGGYSYSLSANSNEIIQRVEQAMGDVTRDTTLYLVPNRTDYVSSVTPEAINISGMGPGDSVTFSATFHTDMMWDQGLQYVEVGMVLKTNLDTIMDIQQMVFQEKVGEAGN